LIENGGRLLRQNISPKQRKAFEIKMGKVFKANIRMLSKEMQEILVDDLVTAFLNRLDVLTRVENGGLEGNMAIQCSNDTFELIRDHPRQG
jgi:hypothetical protein